MNTFKINQVCYDSENKEPVKITNGIEKEGKLVPTEAIAIRFLGMNDNGRPVLAFTYRKVNADFLAISTGDADIFDELFNAGKKAGYIGRV